MKLAVEDLDFASVALRAPFQFGASVVESLCLSRVAVRLSDGAREAVGHGQMTLGNAWSFPSAPHEASLAAMKETSQRLARALDASAPDENVLAASMGLHDAALEAARHVACAGLPGPMPPLCAMVCASPFDMALFDAWGRLHSANAFALLRAQPPSGRPPGDFPSIGPRDIARALASEPARRLHVFHAVGGLDPLDDDEPASRIGDGLPETLADWIRRDGLTRFKIKLTTQDPAANAARVAAVHRTCAALAPDPLYSLDMNEQCPSGDALAEFFSRLARDHPQAFRRIAFVEQPGPRDLMRLPECNVQAAARMKPVLVDEGLTSPEALEEALRAGYSGLCIKACKGIGFSVLMAALARQRGLAMCAQDLTCTGTAFMASAALAAWLGLDALEANARQFCPHASRSEAARWPAVFRVSAGEIDTAGLVGPGLGFER